jgi:hypothetical protein
MVLTFAQFNVMLQERFDHFEKFDYTFRGNILKRTANNQRVIFYKNLVQERFVLCCEGLFEDDLIRALIFSVINERIFGFDQLAEFLNFYRIV